MGNAAAPSLRVPDWQHNPGAGSLNQFGNDQTRDALKNLLLRKPFPRDELLGASHANPEIRAAILDAIGFGSHVTEAFSAEDLVGTDDGCQPITKRLLGTESIIASMTRLNNYKVKNFFVVVLSLMALMSGCSTQFWGILVSLGILFGKGWVVDLARELGDDVFANPPAQGVSRNIGFVVFDNKAYFDRTVHIHAEIPGQARRANGVFVHTVNRLQVPVFVGANDIPLEKGWQPRSRWQFHLWLIAVRLVSIAGEWSRELPSLGVIPLFTQNFDSFLKDTCWFNFISLHNQGTNILHHPDYTPPDGAHMSIYDPAVIGVNTAAYSEVEEVLAAIASQHIDGPSNTYKVMFVVGDQQSYDRMSSLIRENPLFYNWIIPIPGDFHFYAHSIDAFNKLWYNELIGWAAAQIPDRTIKEVDDNISNHKHYDRFYQMLTLAIVTVLCETFSLPYLQDPMELLQHCDSNRGAFQPLDPSQPSCQLPHVQVQRLLSIFLCMQVCLCWLSGKVFGQMTTISSVKCGCTC